MCSPQRQRGGSPFQKAMAVNRHAAKITTAIEAVVKPPVKAGEPPQTATKTINVTQPSHVAGKPQPQP